MSRQIIRGMPVVEVRLTKGEQEKRLRSRFREMCRVKYRKGVSLRRQTKKELDHLVEVAYAKWSLAKAKEFLAELEHPINRNLDAIWVPVEQEKFAKKHKVLLVSCLGNSRKKCPKCDTRLKMYPMPFKRIRRLCFKCGYTDGRSAFDVDRETASGIKKT